jgi:GT2 family glycosyltransferase
MTSSAPTVHVVIPNFNGRRFLDTCLRSLGAGKVPGLGVTVVDNGSSDGSAACLRSDYPWVNCLELPENQGFSAAVNAGIKASDAEFVFLLNNDTELDPDCVRQLLRAAEEQPEFSFFAPKMLAFDNRSVLDGAGDGYLRGGAGYRLGTMEEDSEQYNRERPVFGACAGAVLYRRAVFDRAGFFDEDFFAYLEDVDLNLRMNRAGLRGCYVPGAVVYHIGSATTGSKINDFTVRLSTRNSFFVLLKHYSLGMFLRLLPVIVIYQLCWLLFAVKKGQFAAYCRGVAGVFSQLRRMRQKHRALRAGDRQTAAEFAACLQRAEGDVVESIMRRRSEQGRGNTLLRLYGSLFLR